MPDLTPRTLLNLDVRGALYMTLWSRFGLVAFSGAGIYWLLLEASYRLLEGSYVPVPKWWFEHLHPRPLATDSWFALLNTVGAALAGIPVAICVVLFVKNHRPMLGLLIGIPPSIYIMGSGLIAYGLPNSVAAWVVDTLQLLSIGLAVSLAVVLFSRLPLTFVPANTP
jgi:hypothetical protein